MSVQFRLLRMVAWSAILLAACSRSGGDDSRHLRDVLDGGAHDAGEDGGQPADGSVDPVSDASDRTDGSVHSDAGPSPECDAAGCSAGQRCELAEGVATCIDNECEELVCGETQVCAAVLAGGHRCEDAVCNADVDCPAEFHCVDELCVPDVCDQGIRSCNGSKVLECSASGATDPELFTCGSAAYFTSSCVAASSAGASCSCQDDWDCPAFTVCDVGQCTGTGVEPSCRLPAGSFSSTPPAVELHWGSDAPGSAVTHDGTAAQTPVIWPTFNQAANTPTVANLDDDNGDGEINELDFPEIIFVTHEGADNVWLNGVLRVIHGGGPLKGADAFARCGNTLWTRGQPFTTACSRDDAAGGAHPDLDSGAAVAVGDLDNDGVPEIVYVTENATTSASSPKRFRILSNTGALLYELPVASAFTMGSWGAGPSIANLDYKGFSEIVIGNKVYVLGKDAGGAWIVTHILSGANGMGINELGTSEKLGPMSCVADNLPGVAGQEIVAGASLYRMPDSLATCASPPCAVPLATVWNAATVNSAVVPAIDPEGFCAVADVWGADTSQAPGPNNRPDGKPEVILIHNGSLIILNGIDGTLIDQRALYAGATLPTKGAQTGGAPNVDDFDGDGFPEIASALSDYYIVVDLQPPSSLCPDWPVPIPRLAGSPNPPEDLPRTLTTVACTTDTDCESGAVCNETIHHCVCLHNGWKRDSDDDSSRATSSSVFDFNGDGAAEVIYNDECDFRVYDGTTGEELFSQDSRSRTLIENPVVADVDNDGNAEVVTVMNTAADSRCDEDRPADNPATWPTTGPSGLRVWGDPTDTWVAARRIWNEQSYHITNVTEAGGIPQHEAESWKTWNGRGYNSYRSQPRSYGVAPDLTIAGVGVSSPDVACGSLSDNIDIAFEVKNAGDLRVGPGVAVRFLGTWNEFEEPLLDSSHNPLEIVLQTSLEPGKSVILSVNFAQGNNAKSELPTHVRVVVDPEPVPADGHGAERECHEDNNDLRVAVEQGNLRPDLVLELGAATPACPGAHVQTVVRNQGTAPANGVVVRYYAGNPSQGGSVLYEQALGQPLGAGEEQSFVAEIPTLPGGRTITIYAVVDPDRKVDECNEANNNDAADNALPPCIIIPG
jgi:hypothetical protein